MGKNYSRDVQLLLYILKNQMDIQAVIKDFNCDFSQTNKSVANNKYAFDLCALYMAQIGEKVKLLTDDTQNELSNVMNISILKYFRNIIDHQYEEVNKVLLQAYIQSIMSDKTINAVKKRIEFCKQNKGK